MEKPSQPMFTRAVLSEVRIMMQIVMSWLVITCKWNTQFASLVLYPYCLQVKGSEQETFQYIKNSSCGPELSHTRRVTT
jgi:hypothetical protein